MAQPLQNITLGSPGFRGLNSEDSPIALDPNFATTANNAVIDKLGRLGARKGFNTLTDTITALGGEPVEVIGEWEVSDGTRKVFVAGNNKLFRLDSGVLTELTLPVGYTISGNDWAMVSFNDEMYFFQSGHKPLIIDATLDGTDTLEQVEDHTAGASSPPSSGIAIGALGRMWAVGTGVQNSTVFWSDLLIGDEWATGTSGSLDITTVWPNGYDEITGLAVHNEFLIIFGRNNIVTYSGATSPSTMALSDTVAGIGCIERNTIQHTGTDILFLSTTGVRSLGRTIQEKSIPISDISNNVRSDLLQDISNETQVIRSAYSPEEAFYLLHFESLQRTYCFDMRIPLEDGTRRVTIWPGAPFVSSKRADDGTLYVGGLAGVGTYSGYQDDGEGYRYQYFGPALTFGEASRLKILKKIRPTMIGGASQVATVSWGYGYSGSFSTQNIQLGAVNPAEYGVAEYNIAEYSGGIEVTDENINSTGSGTVVNIGVGIDINGSPFSLQEINVQTLIGRVL